MSAPVTNEFSEVPESASFLHEDAKEPASRERSGCRLWPPTSRIVTYASLAANFILIYVILLSSRASSTDGLPPSEGIYGNDTPLRKVVVFNPDDSYDVDPFGPDGADSAWSKLIPPGKGHIRVDDPSAWGLSGGYPLDDREGSTSEEYTIALFHQLHCLAAIKSKTTRLQDWYNGDNDKEYLAFAIGQDQVSDQHIYHCFDYIRQALKCHGDTTLEGGRTVDGRTVRGVDGWGVAHECRDYEAIYSFAEEHRSVNLTGID